jgi:hypothetical protein
MMTPQAGEQAEHTRFRFHKVTTSQPRHQIDPGCQRCQHCFMRRWQQVALLSNASGREQNATEEQPEQKRGSLCP